MNAKEALRRYLEQRRETGENELVLDRMTVDEVMRLLGAGTAAAGDASVTNVPDWRAALRDPGDAGARPEGERHVDPPARAVESSVAGPAAAADTPRAPARRRSFADEASAVKGEKGEKAGAAPALEDLPRGLVVGSAASELFAGPGTSFATLDALATAVAACTKCALYRTAKNPVPGEGNPSAGLMCVGEAPGAVEDETGRPFVGPAGQLLDRILAAIKLSRNDVYICNVLKHRPPGNRNPMPDEVEACSPFLIRQIELIRPKVIVAFGTFAAQTLLNTKDAIGKLRGKIHRYYGVPLVVTYHPAALLRNPAWKRPTWEDVQLARRLLDRPNDL